jgi:hypothetical protein
MIGVEHESTEAHKLPSTSGQPSLDVRSPLSEAAAKLLYKRMRVRKEHPPYIFRLEMQIGAQ